MPNEEVEHLRLSSDGARGLLRDAIGWLDALSLDGEEGLPNKEGGNSGVGAIGVRGSAGSSSDEEDRVDEASAGSSSSSEESSCDEGDAPSSRSEGVKESFAVAQTSSGAVSQQKVNRKKSRKKKREKNDIVRQMGFPPSLVVHCPKGKKGGKDLAIVVPMAVMPQGNTDWSLRSVCKMGLDVSEEISAEGRAVVVLLLSSGRFAGAVFKGDRCVAHRVCTQYTVRRGQGGAQSSMDSSKGKAKSIGAQLRRAGEIKLREDIKSSLLGWRSHIDEAAIILLSCPKTMRKSLHEDAEVRKFFPKDDERIRKVPLAVGRPSFESACAVNEVMMRITVRPLTDEESIAFERGTPAQQELGGGLQESVVGSSKHESERDVVQEAEEAQKEVMPLTPLHEAAVTLDLVELTKLLELGSTGTESNARHDIDTRAGETEMTPLHVAASSTDPTKGAEFVSALLLSGHANPCVVDGRNRPPYFVASHEKIRDAFRKARSTLGEDKWNWDDGKVGPPLSVDDLERRKAKAAEKKRKQRARQKEKKAKEKAEAESEKQKLKEEEDKKKAEEDAKRIRAGLKPKKSTAADNACDFCQKPCKRRSQMFTRLEFAYCSTECVKRHQRELTARAALSRLGG
uniref:VLRF1 domain-containing protein n=1 Tax=Odontella aurita TaxID=265563 RepID=A0A7S4JVM2_9STRA|mmetsp:Transcript_55279/g.165665  ORF Transcript_55279/g.165665 Transcript_55279/m.165665 type:complete len:627 (+) Transcript_55279:258-2138(+)